MKNNSIKDQTIALFSMEIGLSNEIPTYSGGLGVLVGDMIRTSADLKLPVVAVTLMSKKGYCKQKIVNDKIEDCSDEWDPLKYLVTWANKSPSFERYFAVYFFLKKEGRIDEALRFFKKCLEHPLSDMKYLPFNAHYLSLVLLFVSSVTYFPHAHFFTTITHG